MFGISGQCFQSPQLDGAVLFAAAMLAASIAIGTWMWRHRFDPGQRAFRISHVALIWWLTGTLLELVAPTLACKTLVAELTYPGIALLAMSWSLFLVDYALGTTDDRARWRDWTLAGITLAVLALALTNHWHHALYTAESHLQEVNGRISGVYVHGWLFDVVAAHHYAWIVTGVGATLWAYLRSAPAFRPFFGSLLFMTVVPVAANISYLLGGFSFFGFDPTPFAFAVTLGIFAWMIVNNRMLDANAVAHSHVYYAAADAIFVLDHEGEVLEANPVARDLMAAPSDDTCRAVRALSRSLTETGAIDVTDRLSINGRIFRPSARMVENPIHRERRHLGWTVTLYDVTEEERVARSLQNAKERAEAATRMQSDFLSTVSHELRAPLTSIRGSLELITGGAMGDIPDRAAHSLGIASRNSRKLALLIDDLLDLQKLENGDIEFDLHRADLRDIVAGAVEEMMGYGSDRRVRLRFRSCMQDCEIFADENRLSQVLVNVISNAVKFSHDDGIVEVSVAHRGSHVAVCVADKGVGIPEGSEDKVFGRFAQIADGSGRARNGTGLGMNISQLIMQKHGGEISYRSELGVGTTFQIALPLASTLARDGEDDGPTFVASAAE